MNDSSAIPTKPKATDSDSATTLAATGHFANYAAHATEGCKMGSLHTLNNSRFSAGQKMASGEFTLLIHGNVEQPHFVPAKMASEPCRPVEATDAQDSTEDKDEDESEERSGVPSEDTRHFPEAKSPVGQPARQSSHSPSQRK